MKTALRIFKGGQEIPVPPGSHRFLDYEQTPIPEAADYARGLNGSVVPLKYAEMRRLGISISCSDQRGPAISMTASASRTDRRARRRRSCRATRGCSPIPAPAVAWRRWMLSAARPRPAPRNHQL